MKHIRKFKTVVITRKKILTVFAVLLTLIVLFGALRLCGHSRTVYTLASSQDMYANIIEKTIPSAKENKTIDIKKIVTGILGFDAEDPVTIIKHYHPAFEKESENNPVEPSASPVSSPKPTDSANQDTHNIEEVKISKGLSINNKTTYSVDPAALAAQPLDFNVDNNGPQVLIVHTHTTESYTDSEKNKYSSSDSDRSTDETKNITAVGNAVCDILNQNGIQTVHDTTVHDYPSYNGAYGRSLTTVKNNLSKYPSVKVVLDIHRDGMVKSDGTKLKVATDINQVKTAQVMLVVGTNASGLLHDKWKENLKFACKIQNAANEKYPTLMRPIDLREERFNQHMTEGSLIIEIGSNGNTLEEAIEGGKDIARVISEVLKNNQ